MPITGPVSDLSLGELIELFCNRRKTGRLTVTYPEGVAYFYLKPGVISHASFGNLSGAEAIDYALALPNGSFVFSAGVEPPEKTIERPWTSVVLEGLRRLDEGIMPQKPFADSKPASTERAIDAPATDKTDPGRSSAPVPYFGFLSFQYNQQSVFSTNRWSSRTVIAAVLVMMAIVGVPWGWYTHNKAARLEQSQAAIKIENIPQPSPSPTPQSVPAVTKK